VLDQRSVSSQRPELEFSFQKVLLEFRSLLAITVPMTLCCTTTGFPQAVPRNMLYKAADCGSASARFASSGRSMQSHRCLRRHRGASERPQRVQREDLSTPAVVEKSGREKQRSRGSIRAASRSVAIPTATAKTDRHVVTDGPRAKRQHSEWRRTHCSQATEGAISGVMVSDPIFWLARVQRAL